MRAWALAYLRCPHCRSRLELADAPARAGDDGDAAILRCVGEACRLWYPVIRGVPRLLTGALRDAAILDFGRVRPDVVRELEPAGPAPVPTDPLHDLKRSTIETFGFEWTEYARFGWDDPVYDAQRERAVFLRKSLLREDDLRGKLVLDAGSGNGRYSAWAARLGGRVFAVDLGDGVDPAAANTRDQDAIQVVQADIFALPLEPGTFDVVFSIGVLMHTGDARRAVESLAGVLASGGSLSVHVYGRGNAVYEAVDRALRARTTLRSIPELLRFTGRLYRLRRWLERLGLAGVIGRFVRLDPHPHCIFDWYAAPVATHHTYPEVLRWFGEMGLRVVATNQPSAPSRLRRALRPVVGAAATVTVRGVPA